MDPIFQWVPQTSMLPESPQHEQQNQTSSSLEDWSKERQSTMPQTDSIGTGSSSGTNTMDISDFTTLGDLGAAPALLASPQAFYSQLSQSHNQYFLPSYPTLPYGSSTWSSIPLSTYSTLNGATSTSNTTTATQSQQPPVQLSQQQSPPPHSPTTKHHSPVQQQAQTQTTPQSVPIQPQPPDSTISQPVMIDPSLTTLSGANPNLQPYGSVFASQPQRQQYPYTQTSLFIPHYYRQQAPASQGTLSPQALMSPTTLTVNPATFYGAQTSTGSQQPQQDSQTQLSQRPTSTQQPPSSQASLQQQPQLPVSELSLEEIAQRKVRFYSSIKPLLQSSAFTGAQAVNTLMDRILNNIQDTDPAIRLEILTKIRDGAGNHYFRAWSENSRAIDLTREWLRAAYSANDDSPLIETIMPLLHIIDRLPLTVETLKASKLGKLVVKLVKDPPSPAIKDMASNIERRWRQLVNAEGTTATPNPNSAEDSKSKKRKLSELPAKPLPPQKKQAISSTTATTKPIAAKDKNNGKSAASATAVKDAKSDSSFFSAPKPKPKLPSFKKAQTPVLVKKQEDNVAQPSSVDPFQDILKTMKARKESPAVSTPPPTVNTPPQTSNLSKNGKKKKAVTWAPDALLESVRLIERAVYDDDPQEGVHTGHSLRDLDRGEGAALHAKIFEETVDWIEPALLDRTDIDTPTRGERSQEKATQEHREQTALSAVYMTPQMIPDSPAEPAAIISEEEVDRDVVTMICGESDSIFWNGGGVPIEPMSHAASVADLVGQLATGGVDPAMGGTHFNSQGLDLKSVGLNSTSATLSAVSALPQEQLQQLLQQLASYGPAGSNPSSSFNDIDPGFVAPPNQYANDYGQNYYDDNNERERWQQGGGRGRGRGRGGFGRGGRGGSGRGSEDYRHSNKRKSCSFFAAGKCKFGDQCDFAHEIVS